MNERPKIKALNSKIRKLRDLDNELKHIYKGMQHVTQKFNNKKINSQEFATQYQIHMAEVIAVVSELAKLHIKIIEEQEEEDETI